MPCGMKKAKRDERNRWRGSQSDVNFCLTQAESVYLHVRQDIFIKML
jgi:hypothetical protein